MLLTNFVEPIVEPFGVERKRRRFAQNLHWKLGRLTPSFGSILAVQLKNMFFRNKAFFCFSNLFEIEFHETSQNFNSFSLSGQFLFLFFLSVVWSKLKFSLNAKHENSNLELTLPEILGFEGWIWAKVESRFLVLRLLKSQLATYQSFHLKYTKKL